MKRSDTGLGVLGQMCRGEGLSVGQASDGQCLCGSACEPSHAVVWV